MRLCSLIAGKDAPGFRRRATAGRRDFHSPPPERRDYVTLGDLFDPDAEAVF